MNAMNKLISKKIFINHKIKTPKYVMINKKNYNFTNFKRAVKIKKLKYPIVIKPNNEGSSIGVRICKNLISLKKNINILLKTYDTLIVENFIGGQEIQVAVLNGIALGAIELNQNEIFTIIRLNILNRLKLIILCQQYSKKYNEVLNRSKNS